VCSSISLIECVNNFIRWTGASIPKALKTVTSTPARMLSLEKTKGCLDDGADADLVIFSEGGCDGDLVIDQVWKFGSIAYDRHS
jgi:N-acetylglucosamine-6-phosphate deacetylase